MSLPGGPADKLGNRYELWWTVSELLQMLRGDGATGIRIEDPGTNKAEFVVLGAIRELHQAKRKHSSGKWSLNALAAGGTEVLQAIQAQLVGNSDRFVFVSGSAAPDLSELSDRARSAEGLEEFEAHFLDAKEWADEFARLCKHWGDCDAASAYDLLRRISVRTLDESSLQQRAESMAQLLFLAEPSRVTAELRGAALDSVQRTITREALVEHLSSRGLILRKLAQPADAIGLVREATKRYLDLVRPKLIQGTLLPRTAVKAVADRIGQDGTIQDTVLTGKAGAGKTACVIGLVERLQAQGTPVLAFRMDRLPQVANTNELGDKLGLEESPVLTLSACGPNTALVIDQLDAMSTVTGRGTGAFDLLASLLNEIRGLKNGFGIRVVVVCRSFDWENDHRLRRLLPENHVRVEAQEFGIDEVRQVLTSAGFDVAQFLKRQLELLRLPQNLSLFLDSGFKAELSPGFNTQKELFDRYWDEKRRAVSERAGGQDRWVEVIGVLVDGMNATRQLSVSKETLDHLPKGYIDQMTSEGVLTFDGLRHGFGHESFLDYCFARGFTTTTRSLAAFLIESEQHLFRRAQVRQVLIYLRDADPPRYRGELATLLAEPRVRGHIKDLTLALIADIPNPSDGEWTVWEPLISHHVQSAQKGRANDNPLSVLAWRRFHGAPSWFDYADQRGLPTAWLADERLADVAVWYLRAHQSHRSDRVAELLTPYADQGGNWPLRLRRVVEWADHCASRHFLDLILRLIDNGTLDEAKGPIAQNSTLWSMFHDLGTDRPDWVPEVAAHWLRRRQKSAGGTAERRELFPNDRFAGEPLAAAAEKAPEALIEYMLPAVLDLSDSTLFPDQEPPRRDAVWISIHHGPHLSAPDACIEALHHALAAIATGPSKDVRRIIDELRRRDTYVSNFLLLELYRAGAARFGDESATLLAADPWRFDCGYSGSDYWLSTQLIEAAAPHCTPGALAQLEKAILQYRSRWERSPDGYKSSGSASYELLSAIPAALLSAAAGARHRELERKFGEFQGRPPRAPSAGWVRSPIAGSALDEMSDKHWLSAIAKYDSEHSREADSGHLKGGARQLAQSLKARVERDPTRFARLSIRFPAGANPYYLSHVLVGLKGAAIPSDLKLAVCEKAFQESPEAYGQQIVDLLGDISDRLPDRAVEMLHWLATQHPDPQLDTWIERIQEGASDGPDEILTNGINTTRGGAAEAIRDLIFRDADYVVRFRPTLEALIRDPSIAVLSCVASTLYAVAAHDANLAFDLCDRMPIRDDRLLATPHLYDFMRVGVYRDFSRVFRHVRRMVLSKDPKTSELGAQLAALSALSYLGTTDTSAPRRHLRRWTGWFWRRLDRWRTWALIRRSLKAGASHHLGLARVAAANVADSECRDWCETRLRALFDDADEEARTEAASCWRYLAGANLTAFEQLIRGFCESRAFENDTFSILHTLDTSTYQLPGISTMVCGRFLDRFGREASDLRTPRAGDARTVAKLIFRTYHQHQDDAWTATALDLIDRLCLEAVPFGARPFEDFER